MRRPTDCNWTTQIKYLALGTALLAPMGWSQTRNWDPSAEIQRKQQAEELYRSERWVPGAPYPLTPFEQRMRAVQMEKMPSDIRKEPVKPGVVSVKELRNPISKQDAQVLEDIQKDLQGDDRESALRELNAALAEPQLANHARAILGVDALRNGDMDGAVKALSEAARRMPNNASVRGYLGVALAASGWTNLAEEELRRALSLQPNLAIAQYVLGVVLLNQPQRYLEAEQCLRAAGAVIPQARVALAVLYAISGEQKRMRDVVESTDSADVQWVLTASRLPQPSSAFGVQSRDDEPTPPEFAQRD